MALLFLNLMGKKLKFQYQWLEKWNWSAYSKELNGTFCEYCILLFCNDYVRNGSHENIGSLVAKPFIKRTDAIDKFLKWVLIDFV